MFFARVLPPWAPSARRAAATAGVRLIFDTLSLRLRFEAIFGPKYAPTRRLYTNGIVYLSTHSQAYVCSLDGRTLRRENPRIAPIGGAPQEMANEEGRRWRGR